jgi:hypothetical protein
MRRFFGRWGGAYLIGTLTVLHLGLTSSRFCYPQMRWLSDSDLIDAVLALYDARAGQDSSGLQFMTKLREQRDTCCFVSTFWDGDYLNGPVARGIMHKHLHSDSYPSGPERAPR